MPCFTSQMTAKDRAGLVRHPASPGSHMQVPQDVGHPPLLSQAHYQGAEAQEEQPGLKPAPAGNARASGSLRHPSTGPRDVLFQPSQKLLTERSAKLPAPSATFLWERELCESRCTPHLLSLLSLPRRALRSEWSSRRRHMLLTAGHSARLCERCPCSY